MGPFNLLSENPVHVIQYSFQYSILILAFVSASCVPQEDTPIEVAGQEIQEAFTLLEIGEAVPAYSVITTDSEKLTIGAGQPLTQPLTLLNLWAPWCAPCRQEFPYLERIHKELGPEGLQIIAVDVDPDPIKVVQNFKAEYDITFTVAVDPAGTIQDRYKALGLPTSFLIDEDGTLLEIWTGIVPSSIHATLRKHLGIDPGINPANNDE